MWPNRQCRYIWPFLPPSDILLTPCFVSAFDYHESFMSHYAQAMIQTFFTVICGWSIWARWLRAVKHDPTSAPKILLFEVYSVNRSHYLSYSVQKPPSNLPCIDVTVQVLSITHVTSKIHRPLAGENICLVPFQAVNAAWIRSLSMSSKQTKKENTTGRSWNRLFWSLYICKLSFKISLDSPTTHYSADFPVIWIQSNPQRAKQQDINFSTFNDLRHVTF